MILKSWAIGFLAVLLLPALNLDAQHVLPGPVTNLQAEVRLPGGTVIHLSWAAADSGTDYEVWRSATGDFAQAEKVNTVRGAVKYDDDLTRAGTSYTYWVKGANAEGVGLASFPVTAVQTNQLWAVPFAGAVFAAPLVATNGTVFLFSRTASGRGELAAYQPDGSRLWVFQCDGWPAQSGVIAPNGNIVFSTEDAAGAIYAVSSVGELVWRTPLNRGMYSALAVDAYGTSYVLADDTSSSTSLYALSTDGVLLWRASVSGSRMDRPSIGLDGTVFAATSMELRALEHGGSTRWKLALPPRRNWFPPALGANGDLHTGLSGPPAPSFLRVAESGLVRASNTLSGVSWNVPREPALSSDGRILFIAERTTALCLNSSGVPIWTNRFSTGFTDPWTAVPAFDALGNAYVISATEVVVINQQGEGAGRFEIPSPPTAPPVLSPNGALYIVSNQRLRALPALAGLDSKSPWPMFRGNPQGTACLQRQTDPPLAPALLPARPFANKVQIESQPSSPPAALVLYRGTATNFADATLIARGRAGELFADDTNAAPGVAYYYWARLENAGGASALSGPVLARAIEVPVKWSVQIPDLTATPPAVGGDGTIYTCGTNRLLAISPVDGAQKWEVSGVVGAPMLSSRGEVVLRTGNTVWSLSQAGKTNWAYEGVYAHDAALPAIGPDGRVVFLATPDEIRARSAVGEDLWRNQVTNHALYPLALANDGSAILMDGQTKWVRISPDGATTAIYDLDAYFQVVAPPVIDAEDTLYYPCLNELVAVRADGTNKWKFPLASIHLPVVGADATVFMGHTIRSRVKAVSAIKPDGTLGWTFEVGDSTTVHLVLSGEALLIAAAGTNLFALDTRSGALAWQMNSPNLQPFGPPALDFDGTLYVPSPGALTALQLKAGPSLVGWPMDRQNPRRSACVARAAFPRLSLVPGANALSVLAPEGAILLRSLNLQSWLRIGVQAPADAPIPWPLPADGVNAAFFRAFPP
jgi:outer membrane protein assembly factor BamB